MAYDVKLYDGDEANGVASIVATLLDQNMNGIPGRIAIARRMPRPICIYSLDAEDACTVSFRRNDCIVYNGIVGHPSVLVKATTDDIIEVSQLRMDLSGLVPTSLLFTPRGMKILLQILKHKLVVKGLILHPITSLQVIGLFSIIPPHSGHL